MLREVVVSITQGQAVVVLYKLPTHKASVWEVNAFDGISRHENLVFTHEGAAIERYRYFADKFILNKGTPHGNA